MSSYQEGRDQTIKFKTSYNKLSHPYKLSLSFKGWLVIIVNLDGKF